MKATHLEELPLGSLTVATLKKFDGSYLEEV